MDYIKARTYIDESHRFGGEMGLEAITCLLEKLENPQEALQFFHIAGTNGKGSVGAYLAAVLQEAGYRIGRFISPTLYEYRERIQINGVYIEEEAFGRLMDPVVKAIGELEEEHKPLPSPFEIETAISFLYYKEKKCDFVLLECGMGGKTDATNVIRNTKLAVITSISMDHMEYLGNTLGEIAGQKSGIIKPGCRVVTCRQEKEAMDVIEGESKRLGCPLYVGDKTEAELVAADLDHMVFRYQKETYTIHLAGSHQLENAVLALAGIRALQDTGYQISREQIRNGMEKARWNGRFTILKKDPYLVVDGAHNPDAARKLQESLRMYFPDREFVFLMGVFRDKQYEAIAKRMAPMAREIIAMETPDNPRALPAKELGEVLCRYKTPEQVYVADSLEKALQLGMKLAKKEDVIVAFGSLSFIGDLTKFSEKLELE